MRYRPDVDGLRALAVVPVVFFHARVSPFSGGYIGVDVFFVISGYLITSLLEEDIRQGRFSIIRFYERRVRRIIPALLAVLLFASVAAWRLLMPDQFDDFAKSVFATALFASNILFWKEAGYFQAAAIEKPLLHTWSLAVEEQFYIIFPLFLFVAHRWLKRLVVWLVALAIISFALSVWGVAHKPTAAFYLAPTRAWELLLGSLLAIRAIPKLKSPIWQELGGIFGLGLILWGMFTLTVQSPFPGANALFPAGGAALLIYTGSDRLTITRKLLSTKPLVFVGLISYSLYLWHWPILVFAQLSQVGSLTSWQTAALIVLSFVMATLSWRFVEQPFRRRDGVFRQKPLFASTALAVTCLVAFGPLGHYSDGWPKRIPAEVRRLAAFSMSRNPRQSECMATTTPSYLILPKDACVHGADVRPAYALWGDSHADALVEMIGQVARRHGHSVKSLENAGCPPIAGTGRIGIYKGCFSYNEQAIDYLLSDPHLHTIIIAARWSVYIEGFNRDFGPAERDRTDRPFITDETGEVMDLRARENLFARQMPMTVKRLTDAGKTVALVYPIPETGYSIPQTLARILSKGGNPSHFTRPESYYLRRQKFVSGVLDKIGPANTKIIRLRPDRRLCDGTNCIVYANGNPLYRDDDHLSLAGTDYISDMFDPLFKNSSPGQIARP